MGRGVLLSISVIASFFVRVGPAEANVNSLTSHGLPATIVGSGEIVGTSVPDVIVGSEGPDSINGGNGDDIICALGGEDAVKGSSGIDFIF